MDKQDKPLVDQLKSKGSRKYIKRFFFFFGLWLFLGILDSFGQSASMGKMGNMILAFIITWCVDE